MDTHTAHLKLNDFTIEFCRTISTFSIDIPIINEKINGNGKKILKVVVVDRSFFNHDSQKTHKYKINSSNKIIQHTHTHPHTFALLFA